MTNAVRTPIVQGRFLLEAAAVQRSAPDAVLSLVRFPADDAGSAIVTAVVGAQRLTRTLALTSSRWEVASAVLPGRPAPLAGDFEGFPAVSPPIAVYAEVLRDLGSNADALAGYLGASLHYAEIRADGRSSATVRVRDERGDEVDVELSLTSTSPPVGLPYTLVEQFGASGSRSLGAEDIVRQVVPVRSVPPIS
jgi:hypothetical protein